MQRTVAAVIDAANREDSPAYTEALEKLDQMVFCFDGQFDQVRAIMLPKWGDRVRFFKWAAACSLTQQPNDTGRCHKFWHDYFRGSGFRYDEITEANEDKTLLPLKKIMVDAKMEAVSVKVYWKFLNHSERAIDKCFNLINGQSSWRISGTHPKDPDQIMTGYAGWSFLSEDAQKKTIAYCVGPMKEHFEDNHEVDDDRVKEDCKEFLKFPVEKGKSRMDMVPNRKRCIQVSQKFLEKNRLRKAEKKRAEEEAKRFKEEQAEKAREEKRIAVLKKKAEDKKRKEEEKADAGQGLKAARVTKRMCGGSGGICAKDYNQQTIDDQAKWQVCSGKSCRVIFCPEHLNIKTQHESVHD